MTSLLFEERWTKNLFKQQIKRCIFIQVDSKTKIIKNDVFYKI